MLGGKPEQISAESSRGLPERSMSNGNASKTEAPPWGFLAAKSYPHPSCCGAQQLQRLEKARGTAGAGSKELRADHGRAGSAREELQRPIGDSRLERLRPDQTRST